MRPLSTLLLLSLASTGHAACLEIKNDPRSILSLPEGYRYKILMTAGDELSDGNKFRHKPDLNVYLPLKGERALLLQSHELAADREPQWGSGAITRHYLEGDRIIDSRVIADGMRYNCSGSLTPWGTVFTAEEYPRDPPERHKDEGYIFEVDPITGDKRRHDAFGRFSHETAVVIPDGSVLLTEDLRGGFLYRFVPDKKDDYSSGKLSAYNKEKKAWIPVADPFRATRSAQDAGATPFNRLEDLEIAPDGRSVVFTETGDPYPMATDVLGRIHKLDLETWSLATFAEGDGKLMANPDNLAYDGKGRLWVTEDQFGKHFKKFGMNELLVFEPDGKGCAFARTFNECEPTGPVFDPAGKRLFLNLHCSDQKDRALVITGF